MVLPEPTRARLRTQLDSLEAILAGATAEDLWRRPPSGKWSALENLAHLARHHEVFLERVRRVLAEDRPAFPRYRAEEDPEWPAWAGRTWDDVRGRLAAARRELVDLLEGLGPDQLARTAVHSVFGEMAVPLWVEFFLLHEAHHLYAVFARVRGG
jgi:DinB family protein